MIKHFLRFWFAIAALIWIQTGSAQLKLPDNATLDSLNLEYDVTRENLAKPIRDLQGKYQSQLEMLRDKMKAAGELDKTLSINKVLEDFREKPTKFAGNDFPELRRLQSIYSDQASRLHALASLGLPKLVEAHKAKLEMLQKQLTQQNELVEATKAKEVLAKLDETLGIILPKFADKEAPTTPAEVVYSGEKEPFKVGALQFSNRSYVWTKIPEKFLGWKMSMQDGGSEVDSRFRVKTRGLVYAVIDPNVEVHFHMDGWKTIELPVGGRGGGQKYIVVEKAFEPGNHKLSGKGWFTTRVLLPPPPPKR